MWSLTGSVLGGLVFGSLCMAATIGGMKDRYGLLLGWLLLTPLAAFDVVPVMGQRVASSLLGLVLVAGWAVAGLRLGKPWSVWARTFYGSERMAVAQARFPSRAKLPARPLPVRPPRPREVDAAFWLLLVVCAGGLMVHPLSAVFAGPLLAFVLMARMGHHWARVTVTVFVCLLSGVQLFGYSMVPPGMTLIPFVLVVPAAAAVVLLYRPAANRYFRVPEETPGPGPA